MLVRSHENEFLPPLLLSHLHHLYRLFLGIQRLILMDDVTLRDTLLENLGQNLVEGETAIVVVCDVATEHNLRCLSLFVKAHRLTETIKAIALKQDNRIRG